MDRILFLILLWVVIVVGCNKPKSTEPIDTRTSRSLDIPVSNTVNRENLPTPTTDADDTAIESSGFPSANRALGNISF